MRTFLALLGPALLAGCGGFAVLPVPIPLGTFSTGPALQFVPYACEDGSRVEVAYPSQESAILRQRGVPVELARAPAPGTRYAGGGVEWRLTSTQTATLGDGGAAEVACRVTGAAAG
jgi:hypothetical protein